MSDPLVADEVNPSAQIVSSEGQLTNIWFMLVAPESSSKPSTSTRFSNPWKR